MVYEAVKLDAWRVLETSCEPGKRLLGRWLKQPLVNLHEISKSRVALLRRC